MKQKIVAIGDGDFTKYQTLSIDKEIVTFSGKQQPKMLFIPTASSDNAQYTQKILKHYQNLGCIVDSLPLCKQQINPNDLSSKILSADIIYVGGGNTLKMMTLWRRLGVDKLLEQARKQRTVLCGVSAGSICWFNFGNSDSRKDKNPQADYIKVTALGFIDAFHCPHYDSESDRKASLKKMMKKHSGVAIALEDCAALQVFGDTYRIITSNDTARAYKVYWKNGLFFEEAIVINNIFEKLDDLLIK